MSAGDGKGTSRPRIDSYQVHTACPHPQEPAAAPIRNQKRRIAPSPSRERRIAATPAARADATSPTFDTSCA